MLICFLILKVLSQTFNVLDLPSSLSPPSARLYPSMSYTSSLNSLVVFGGNYNAEEFYNDLWLFSLVTYQWSHIQPISSDSPIPRISGSSFFHEPTQEYYIFGGNSVIGPQNDVWKFNFFTYQWSLLNPENPPLARYLFGSTDYIDALGNHKFIVFGGALASGYLNDLVSFDVESVSWTKLPMGGEVPPASAGPQIEYFNNMIYLVAGDAKSETNNYINGTFRYHLASGLWENISSPVTYYSRYYTSTVTIDHYLYLLFGWSDFLQTDLTDIMRLDLNSTTKFNWETVALENIDLINLVRDSFTSASDSNGLVYLFAGYNSNQSIAVNSLVEIDTKALTWKSLCSNSVNPSARMHHSLQVIDGLLYLFGGVSGSTIYNDLWVYDPDQVSWSSVEALGAFPPARYAHASATQGDVMVVWGGMGISGLLNDMYELNILSLTWTLIQYQGTTVPSARMGACMSLILPLILIFGGETLTGLTNEMWVFNTGTSIYNLASPNTNAFDTMIYPRCETVTDNGNTLFYVMYGVTESEQALGAVRYFNFTDSVWTTLFDPGYAATNVGMNIVKLLGSQVISLSGEQWSLNPLSTVFLIDANTLSLLTLGQLSVPIYASAWVYYKKSIFTHGGGSTLGTTLRESAPTEVFFEINIESICKVSGQCNAQCSVGTYLLNGECVNCPKGYYSDTYSDSSCTPCPPGTYNPNLGANSNRQCYPCPEGLFNSVEGASRCLDCPVSLSCPTGSKEPDISPIVSYVSSSQPTVFSQNSPLAGYANFILEYLVLAIFLLYVFMVVVFFNDIEKFIKNIDLYTNLHNYTLRVPVILSRTTYGGIFSVLFILAALFIIISTIITFALDSTLESKSLIPLVILEGEVTAFTAQIVISVTFMRYGGLCVDNFGNCISQLSMQPSGLSYSESVTQCSLSTSNDCTVKFTCNNCAISPGAFLKIILSEKLSYASAISVNITSDSSIPNALSSISESISPPPNTVFRGSNPSYFYITSIPSFFKNQIDNTQATGFHVSSETQALRGSTYLISELAFTSNLQAVISLEKSSSSLYTLRYTKVSFIILLNGLLGSVFGIMSAAGAVMRYVEGFILTLKTNKKTKKKKNILINDRKSFKTQCNQDSPKSRKNNLEE